MMDKIKRLIPNNPIKSNKLNITNISTIQKCHLLPSTSKVNNQRFCKATKPQLSTVLWRPNRHREAAVRRSRLGRCSRGAAPACRRRPRRAGSPRRSGRSQGGLASAEPLPCRHGQMIQVADNSQVAKVKANSLKVK